jgi:hypothetical protein
LVSSGVVSSPCGSLSSARLPSRSLSRLRPTAPTRGGVIIAIPVTTRAPLSSSAVRPCCAALPPDPDWKGNRFVSPSGDAWLAFYARPADKTAHDQHLKSVAFVDGEELTFLRREPDWLEVSGFKGDRNFYRKVVLACGARAWRHVAFEYPAEAKRAFEPLIARMARALDRQVEQNCDAVVGSSR